MKKIKTLSILIASLVLSNTVSHAATLTTIDKLENNYENNNVIIGNDESLSNSMNVYDDLNKPVFIETTNSSAADIAEHFNITGEIDDYIPQEEGLELKGYLVYGDNSKTIEPWLIEVGLAEGVFIEDLNKKVNSIEYNKGIKAKGPTWPVADSYATNLTYTESYVGVSGILYNSGSSSPTGQQDVVVEVTPRTSTYYDYSCEYFTTETYFNNGKVLDYSPENRYNTTSISISYPWGISTSFELGGTFDVTKIGGGVGYNYSEWKFDPNNSSGFKNIKGKTTTEFSSSISTLKSTISTKLTFRSTDKRTGSSSIRTVNYGTSFSS